MQRIPTFTIEAPGISPSNLQDVAGVEFQPIDPAAYQLEAGWLCIAADASEDEVEPDEYFIGQPENSQYVGVTIQRYEQGDWVEIPGARIVGVNWEEL